MSSLPEVEATLIEKLLCDLELDVCIVCCNDFHTLPDPDTVTAELGIALLSCGHAYHNDCMTKWLDTANTCPICRYKFNYIEVIQKPGDTKCTRFECEDKNQVAEFDAAEWAAQNPEGGRDDEDDETYEPDESAPDPDLCPVCERHHTQEIVMICDGCETCMHPLCAGYDEIPEGDWYCPDCTMIMEYQTAHPPPSNWTEADILEHTPGGSRRGRRAQREAEARRDSLLLEHRERERGRQIRRRTRREQRGRSRVDSSRPAWNNVSNSIHAASGLELDFFMDDDPSMANFRRVQRRASEERRELLEWEERLASANRRIASGQAGTSSTRTASAGRHSSVSSRAASRANSRPHSRSGPVARHSRRPSLSNSRPVSAGNQSNNDNRQRQPERRILDAAGPSQRRRSTPARQSPPAASPELDLAWGDFDRAQSMNNSNANSGTNTNTRKRRADESFDEYAEEQSEHQEPERKLKRPRTRAVLDTAGSSSSSSVETPSRPAINTSDEPSFLATLLREVESATGEERFHWSPAVSAHEPATSPSAYHLSPATSPSPVSSNYHTPRDLSITPPPQQPLRTESALSASSRTQSPVPSSVPIRRHHHMHSSPTPEIRQPRPRRQEQFVAPRSVETSPVRATMPIEAKEAINKMVKAALGPHWRSGQLNKDQYFDVNRGVSRQMYEIIGEEYANINRDQHAWERVVSREVAVAVQAATATSSA